MSEGRGAPKLMEAPPGRLLLLPPAAPPRLCETSVLARRANCVRLRLASDVAGDAGTPGAIGVDGTDVAAPARPNAPSPPTPSLAPAGDEPASAEGVRSEEDVADVACGWWLAASACRMGRLREGPAAAAAAAAAARACACASDDGVAAEPTAEPLGLDDRLPPLLPPGRSGLSMSASATGRTARDSERPSSALRGLIMGLPPPPPPAPPMLPERLPEPEASAPPLDAPGRPTTDDRR